MTISSPLNFVMEVALKKTMVIPLPEGGKSSMICAFVSIEYKSVTDRFAATISRCACIGLLTRDKESGSQNATTTMLLLL